MLYFINGQKDLQLKTKEIIQSEKNQVQYYDLSSNIDYFNFINNLNKIGLFIASEKVIVGKRAEKIDIKDLLKKLNMIKLESKKIVIE